MKRRVGPRSTLRSQAYPFALFRCPRAAQDEWAKIFQPNNVPKIQTWTEELVADDTRSPKDLTSQESEDWSETLASFKNPPSRLVKATYVLDYGSPYFEMLSAKFWIQHVVVIFRRGWFHEGLAYNDMAYQAGTSDRWPQLLEYYGVSSMRGLHGDALWGWKADEQGKGTEGCEDMRVVLWVKGNADAPRTMLEGWLERSREDRRVGGDGAGLMEGLLSRAEVKEWDGEAAEEMRTTWWEDPRDDEEDCVMSDDWEASEPDWTRDQDW